MSLEPEERIDEEDRQLLEGLNREHAIAWERYESACARLAEKYGIDIASGDSMFLPTGKITRAKKSS